MGSQVAETIVDLDEDNKMILKKDILEKILLQEHIRDKNVCVISIAGAFRQGKSFVLNFLIRYLNMKYTQKKNVKKWLEGNEALSGFSWQSGPKRHTTGILMWPEVFLAQLPSGEEIAIILLDTQGSFDTTTTITECATIFALSTLISSVQIFNLKENIKQCDLGHLEYFVNYGQMVLDGSKDEGPPFQNLLFLIRDWQWPHEHNYGTQGGEKLLDDILNTDVKDVPPEIIAQRKNVKKMFESISCFLLPHPGENVSTDKEFKGELTKIAPQFKKHMEVFAPSILKRKNLIPKTASGKRITVGELVSLIEIYWECFKSGKMPPLTTLLSGTSKLQHILSLNEAESKYDELMESEVKNVETVFSDEDLQTVHEGNKSIAINHYCETKKMGDEVMREQYQMQLEQKLDIKFLSYKKINELKRDNQQGIISWIRYVFSNKRIVGRVSRVVSTTTATVAGYVTFTNSIAATGIVTEAIGASVISATLGFAAGSLVLTPIAVVGIAVAGWKWWSKRSSRRNTSEVTNNAEELVPLRRVSQD